MIIKVARMPDCGYLVEKQFTFTLDPKLITDLFGEFNKDDEMFLDVDGDPICLKKGEGKIIIEGLGQFPAVIAFYKIIYSAYGILKYMTFGLKYYVLYEYMLGEGTWSEGMKEFESKQKAEEEIKKIKSSEFYKFKCLVEGKTI